MAAKLSSNRRGNVWRPGPIPHTVFHQPCLDFANSVFTDHRGSGERFDRLEKLEWRAWFLGRWQFQAPVRVAPNEMRRLKQLRSLLRQVLERQAGADDAAVNRFNEVLGASHYAWRLDLERSGARRHRLTMQLVPEQHGWPAIMANIVASFAELVVSGDLKRVKRCGNPNCSFLFFDESLNRSRRWCDPALCGNLVKVRAFRARMLRDAQRAAVTGT
jgi:predicted RNA-binding Zn ribbon-like protein